MFEYQCPLLTQQLSSQTGSQACQHELDLMSKASGRQAHCTFTSAQHDTTLSHKNLLQEPSTLPARADHSGPAAVFSFISVKQNKCGLQCFPRWSTDT